VTLVESNHTVLNFFNANVIKNMTLTDKISKYLTVADAIKSETAIRKGIDNSMNETELSNAKYIATKVFDPIKDKFPNAGCYSFFRSAPLNKAVGGSPNSFHSFAGALDIDTLGNVDNKAIFKFCIDGWIPANEIIWEFGNLNQPDWVHIGLLPGYTMKKILHIYHDAKGVKHRDLLTKEQAYKLYNL